MKLLKALGKRLLFPPLLAVLPLALLSTGPLAYVFAAGREDTPLAYAAYALSAYVLVLVCAAVPRMLRLGGQVRQNALVDHLVSDYAFRDCNIEKFVFADGLTAIGKCAFYNSKVKEVVLPSTLKQLPSGLFQKCSSLTTVRLGNAIELLP